jgi:hypothetical protein
MATCGAVMALPARLALSARAKDALIPTMRITTRPKKY